jgi:FixJ family two-component response regulator
VKSGARHFVQKPVKIEALYDAIQQVLGEDGALVSTLTGNGAASRTEKPI